MTCRDTIYKEKESCRDENRSTGALFWRRIRANFGQRSDEQSPLMISDQEVMPEPLWSHFKQLLKHNKAPLNSWLASAGLVDEISFKLLAQALNNLQPGTSTDVYQCGIRILRLIWMQNLHAQYPAIWEAVKRQADSYLIQAGGTRTVQDNKRRSR